MSLLCRDMPLGSPSDNDETDSMASAVFETAIYILLLS